MTYRRPRSITSFHYPLIAIAACTYAASAYAAPVSWNVNASGTWITAADWTSTPALPGPADDVTINQPGNITVTLTGANQSINSLLLDNNLTLSTSLAVATTVQVNGNLTLNGGTLLNATLSIGASGAISFPTGTFDGVTLASNISVNAGVLNLKDGLTLSNTTLSLNNSSTLTVVGNQTIGGTGIVEFDGAGFSFGVVTAPTLTIGSNITIQTGTVSGSMTLTSLINQGVISAQTSGKSISISTSTSFTNTGTLQALNGGAITLAGNLTTGGLGTFNSTGGNITMSGVLDNTGSTLALNGVGNSLILSGTIKNGNISVANGAVLASANGILDNVTLISNLSFANSLFMKDALTLSNSTLVLTNSISLFTGGNQTIGATAAGSGIIEFDGTGVASIQNSGASNLTIGANITIQTGTESGSIAVPTLLNQGIISAQAANKTLTISVPTSFINSGTLQASNNGTLIISSNLTTAQLGTFNSDPVGATTPGTIEISGILDNSSSTLALNGIGNSLLVSNVGTIKNGTISAANGAVLTLGGGATLDGVTLAANVSLANNNNPLILKDGLTLSNATLSLNNGSALSINNNQTLGATAGATGIVEFDGTGTETVTNAAAVLTIGANTTVQTGTGNGTISTLLINQGLIAAKTSGKIITLSGSSLTNSGALQALNGGTLTILSTTWSSPGTITVDSTSTLNLGGTFTTASLANLSRTGGNITITGTLDNTASTFALNAATGNFTLGGSGGTIKNGNVSVTGGAVLTIGGNNTTFDGVTLTSNLPVNNTDLYIKDGLTLANITLSFSSAALAINGNQTISAIAGSIGILEFDGTGTSNIVNAPSGVVTIGSNVTLQTGTGSALIDNTGFINQGVLSAQTSGKTISIGSTTFANSGTLQAFNGGTISILSSLTTAQLGTFNSDPTTAPGFTSPGIIQISNTLDNSNSTLALNGVGNSLTLSGTIKNGNLSVTNGAVLTLGGVPTLDGLTLLSNLTFANNGAIFTKDGLTLANTTLTLNNANLEIINNMTLGTTAGGTGIVEFDSATAGIVGSAVTLTIAPGITVQTGTANGSLSPTTLINQGIISAQTSSKTITIAAATALTNTGTLQALNGGTLNILGNLTTAQLGNFNTDPVGATTPGTIQLSGILDNSNSTLALSGVGNSLLLTGTIKNGNVSIAGGAQLTMNSGTFNVANLTVGSGSTLHQSAGNVTLSTLSQSGGNISLGGAQQLLYAIPTITITGGTTILTKDAIKVLTTTSLTFGGSTNAWTGEFDLTQNKVIVEPTTNKSTVLANLENQAVYGRTHAAGVISSSIPANQAVAVIDNAVTNFSTFGGQPADTGSILIAPELLGDANVDGTVGLSDLAIVLNNFGQNTPAWTSGNFDGTSTIGLSDLADVLNNFGQTLANPHDAQPNIPTPEPTSLVLIAAAIPTLLLRRRKAPR